ncbi:hypothetical protein Q4511_08360 [Paracoccus sp. 1_MG-2023]|uniref:hypothetical protein n=1 Tax=unclassified Paracoccus (in: a-proteobacteria) TaxID=2688777 RepID=UPI001C098D8E|nr:MULTISPECIES: hypothetical protein [unclassified Paracoccus (in: a-proteobacteria)]MBU2957873.1 hypothetical protein [Paracoccus sp. C2R09]MDO6668935.1 hypothetical protein [Paracoccus sp. 1_MG-2023]
MNPVTPAMQRTEAMPGDPASWLNAQAGLAGQLSRSTRELGRLEATIAALPEAEAEGARMRLALLEVEAMLWSQGIALSRDEIGRDLMDARADSDPEALRIARWALRRLTGRADLGDLAAFLGMHGASHANPALPSLRARGKDFDDAAAMFACGVDAITGLEPIARGPAILMLWRQAELSPPAEVVEPAVWSARHMALDGGAMPFVPLGQHGRRTWPASGPVADRLAAHLAAAEAGARDARIAILQLQAWAARARATVVRNDGDNAHRVIGALLARPLVSAMEVEAQAGVSRSTAIRVLTRLQDGALLREVTGGRRFRLWTVAA